MKKMALQPKTRENPNIVDVRSAIIEHLKIFHKLFRTTKQIEKVFGIGGADNALYSEAKKSENFFNERRCNNNQTIACL